jgi:hypothetical protein
MSLNGEMVEIKFFSIGVICGNIPDLFILLHRLRDG